MPGDSLLTPFRTQLVHSKITLTLTSLPLAMNLLFFGFWIHSTLLFSIRSEEKKEQKKKTKIDVGNSKSNYQKFRWNRINNQ